MTKILLYELKAFDLDLQFEEMLFVYILFKGLCPIGPMVSEKNFEMLPYGYIVKFDLGL